MFVHVIAYEVEKGRKRCGKSYPIWIDNLNKNETFSRLILHQMFMMQNWRLKFFEQHILQSHKAQCWPRRWDKKLIMCSQEISKI